MCSSQIVALRNGLNAIANESENYLIFRIVDLNWFCLSGFDFVSNINTNQIYNNFIEIQCEVLISVKNKGECVQRKKKFLLK